MLCKEQCVSVFLKSLVVISGSFLWSALTALVGCFCHTSTAKSCCAGGRSCVDGLWKITRHEGPSVLWHGVNVSVLISVPMICMYLPMYDFLLAELDSSSTYAPLMAGSTARAMSVVATSPLELLKTRIQAAGVSNVAVSRNAASMATPFSAALQQMRSDMKVTLYLAETVMHIVFACLLRHITYLSEFCSHVDERASKSILAHGHSSSSTSDKLVAWPCFDDAHPDTLFHLHIH